MNMNHSLNNARPMLSIREIAEFYSVHHKTVESWVRNGQFPKPLKIGKRLIRWQASVLDIQAAPLEPETVGAAS